MITTQQAIDYLRDPICEGLSGKEKLKLHEEAINMAVKALEKQIRTSNNLKIPNSLDDLISRQDALDIVDDLNSPDWYMEWGAEARKRLVDLPAIKPE